MQNESQEQLSTRFDQHRADQVPSRSESVVVRRARAAMANDVAVWLSEAFVELSDAFTVVSDLHDKLKEEGYATLDELRDTTMTADDANELGLRKMRPRRIFLKAHEALRLKTHELDTAACRSPATTEVDSSSPLPPALVHANIAVTDTPSHDSPGAEASAGAGGGWGSVAPMASGAAAASTGGWGSSAAAAPAGRGRGRSRVMPAWKTNAGSAAPLASAPAPAAAASAGGWGSGVAVASGDAATSAGWGTGPAALADPVERGRGRGLPDTQAGAFAAAKGSAPTQALATAPGHGRGRGRAATQPAWMNQLGMAEAATAAATAAAAAAPPPAAAGPAATGWGATAAAASDTSREPASVTFEDAAPATSGWGSAAATATSTAAEPTGWGASASVSAPGGGWGGGGGPPLRGPGGGGRGAPRQQQPAAAGGGWGGGSPREDRGPPRQRPAAVGGGWGGSSREQRRPPQQQPAAAGGGWGCGSREDQPPQHRRTTGGCGGSLPRDEDRRPTQRSSCASDRRPSPREPWREREAPIRSRSDGDGGAGETLRGTVTGWRNGYGFIKPDGAADHGEDIMRVGHKAGLWDGEMLETGTIVTYVKQSDPAARDGWSAVNVTVQQGGQGEGQQREDYRHRSPPLESPRQPSADTMRGNENGYGSPRQQGALGQLRGTVVERFDHGKAFGFISPDTGGRDIFFSTFDFDGTTGSLSGCVTVRYDEAPDNGGEGIKAVNVSQVHLSPGHQQRETASRGQQQGQQRGTVAGNSQESKGFGFIIQADGGEDLFFRFNQFKGSSGTLSPGVTVHYDVQVNAKNNKSFAVNVSLVHLSPGYQQRVPASSGAPPLVSPRQQGALGQQRGTVADNFEESRGFGFITQADGGVDMFFHFSQFDRSSGTLSAGVTVHYDVKENTRNNKSMAVNVSQIQLGSSGGGGGGGASNNSWAKRGGSSGSGSGSGSHSHGGGWGASGHQDSGNDFGMMDMIMDDHQPPPQPQPRVQPMAMLPSVPPAGVPKQPGPIVLARRAAKAKRLREAASGAATVRQAVGLTDDDVEEMPSPAKQQRMPSQRAQQLLAEAQEKLKQAKAAAQMGEAAGETTAVVSARRDPRRSVPKQGLDAEEPSDKACFKLLTKDPRVAHAQELGWLSFEDVGNPGWREDGFGFEIPDSLEVSSGRNNYRSIHGRFEQALRELPFKMIEAHGETADRRWPRFVQGLLDGSNKAAVVHAEGAVFYLTHERIYYCQSAGEDDVGAPHRVVEEDSSDVQLQSMAPIAELISPRDASGTGGYGMAGGLD